MSVLLSDVVSGSAVGLRGRLWQLSASELREAVVEASAEILRLEAVRVAVVDELSLRPDDQVIASRGVGAWLAANTMLQVRDGKKIAALGAALRPFPAVAARFDCGDCSFDHAVLIVAFCESPPKGMPDEALPRCIDLLLAAASGVEATTTKVRHVIATLERVFESDEIPPAEDVDRNELRIASTLNGRVVVRGEFDALTGEMLLSALSNLTMPTPAPDGTPDARSAAKRTADGFTELIRRYLDCAETGTDGGQRPHVNVHINARDLAGIGTAPPRPRMVRSPRRISMSGTCHGSDRCRCRRRGFSGATASCPPSYSTLTAHRSMRDPENVWSTPNREWP